MNMFVYSFKNCLLKSGFNSVKVGRNLQRISVSKEETLTFFMGKNFENCYYSCDREFCKNIKITDLYGDILCYPILKPKRDFCYKEIKHKSVVIDNIEYFITVYTDGGIKLCCRGFNEEKTVELPFIPEEINVYPVGGSLFLADLKAKLHFVIIFSVPNLSIEFSDLCDEFTINGVLSVTKLHNGIGRHAETRQYNYDGKVNLRNVSFQSSYPYGVMPKEIIPLAFLEEVRLGVDYRHFLGENLMDNYTAITEFFGKMEFCIPPFYREFSDTFAVVGEKVKYAKFTLENRKITDILLESYPF